MNSPTDAELIRRLARGLDPRTRFHRMVLPRLERIASRLDDIDETAALPSSLVSSSGEDEGSEGGQT